MPDPTAAEPRSRSTSELLALQVVDALTYAVAFVAVVFVPVGAFELATIGGLVATKWILFFVGMAYLTYAGLQLRPASPQERAAAADAGPSGDAIGSEELTWLQRAAAALPPARWVDLHPSERWSAHAKLLVGALVMLTVSMALEFALDVTLVA
jgi:hypothetical protein